MEGSDRWRAASRASGWHFLASVLVAALAAALVFGVWYPAPYSQLSGGRELFLILVGVDVVCGPLLTLVLFNPRKPRRELVFDMSLVVVIQFAALAYGLFTAFQARPLFLVHEVDRFRVISVQDFQGVDVVQQIASLDPSLQPGWRSGPVTVGIRDPLDRAEQQRVLMESVVGGRDYSQRPEFYVPYDSAYSEKALSRAKPLQAFVEKYADTAEAANAIAQRSSAELSKLKFLPVLHRQDWVAVLDAEAAILGFLPGDGFAVTVSKP
jgi:hypothetical protein